MLFGELRNGINCTWTLVCVAFPAVSHCEANEACTQGIRSNFQGSNYSLRLSLVALVGFSMKFLFLPLSLLNEIAVDLPRGTFLVMNRLSRILHFCIVFCTKSLLNFNWTPENKANKAKKALEINRRVYGKRLNPSWRFYHLFIIIFRKRRRKRLENFFLTLKRSSAHQREMLALVVVHNLTYENRLARRKSCEMCLLWWALSQPATLSSSLKPRSTRLC